MSKRSHRRHRQPKHRNDPPPPEASAAPAQHSRGGTKGRAVLIGAGVVVVAAVLYAVSAGSGRKGGDPTASSTNAVAAAVPTPAISAVPFLSATAPVAAAAGVSGPKIAFATPVHDFGRIKGGEVLKYTYVFTNLGGAVLEVSNVQTSCGCTTAGEWTRQVEPGKTGSIPIQFNSANFSGQVGKSITVTCNDPTQPSVKLDIKANIWRPIDVTPQYAMLNVTADAPSNATTVRIVNNEEAPLTLAAPESSNPALAAELKTNEPGKAYEVVIRTVPPLPAGNVQGQITLKTSSTNLPVINVSAWANVQPAVMAMPSQITLPAAPLANPMPSTISIRNNGTNALVLTEPAVNAKGVDVRLNEVQPGRFFTLTVNFPAGFEMAQGEKVELSVKSNHPQFPMIKVPVIQPPRPAASVVPLGTPAMSPSPSQ